MIDLTEYMASGILELYVLGLASPEETRQVEQMAIRYPEIRREIEDITESLETYALAYATQPHATVKPLVLATIDYLERTKAGAPVTEPPIITASSQITDYATWLNRPDMVAPLAINGLSLKIISATPIATTVIAWLTDRTEAEVHSDVYEQFLIVEGTCTIIAGDDVCYLAAGDYYAVPLHTSHVVEVTSASPCKAIVQRLAVQES